MAKNQSSYFFSFFSILKRICLQWDYHLVYSFTMPLKPPLTGNELRQWIDSPTPMREPIVEGLLNEKSCLIIAADSGLGKSVISLQACLELSAGLPLFRRLEVKRSYRCYYVLKERPMEEMGERIQYMQTVLTTWNPDNVIIDNQIQSFSLARESNFEMIYERIIPFKPEVIFIDPIYAGTPGLSKDEVASSFTNFLTILEQRSGAAIWLNHHVTKTSYDRDGLAISKDDPMYGSAWIKAHVTGAYLMTKTDLGCHLQKKKDSHSSLLDSLKLDFDSETYISTANQKGGSGHDRFMLFLNRVKKENRRFKIGEVMAEIDLSYPSITRLFDKPPFKGHIFNVSALGTKGLYEYRD